MNDVGNAEVLNVGRAAIGGKGALYDSECTVLLNGFGQSYNFLAVGQRGFDGLPDRTAALLVGEGDSLRSMGLKLFNTCFKFVQELRKKPIAFDGVSCFMTDGCGRFSQVFWEVVPISVDVQPNADDLKRSGSCHRSTFAEDAANLTFGDEYIIRPFHRDACCGNRFDGFSRSQGSNQREPREPLGQPIGVDQFSDDDGAIQIDAWGRKPLSREPATAFRLRVGHHDCAVFNTCVGEGDRLAVR